MPGGPGRSLLTERAADWLVTLLVINAVGSLLRGAVTLSVGGVVLRGPSFEVSLAALLVCLASRRAWTHRRALGARLQNLELGEILPGALLAVFVVAGLGLRLWGIGFGGPLVIHPDEQQVAGVAIRMLKQGWIAPPVPYHYPTVLPYLLLPAFGLRYVVGKGAGTWATLDDIAFRTFDFYLVARVYSAVLGSLTIVATYYLARALWPGQRGRWVGTVGAAVVTFCFNHVRQSHFAVTDVAMTLFVVLALIAVAHAHTRGTTGAYVVAGLLTGLACATKYSALPVVFVLVAGHLLDRRGAPFARAPRLVAGLAAVPLGFFVGYPYALLNWRPFLEHLGWLASVSAARAADPVGRFSELAAYSVESGFGWPWTVAISAALLFYLHRRQPAELLLITLVVAVLASISHSTHRWFPRYLLPMMPAAALLSGALLVDVVGRLPGLLRFGAARQRWFGPICLTGLTALMIWPQAVESVQLGAYLALPDTRTQARAYVLRRFPSGVTVVTEDRYFELPTGYRVLVWRPAHSRPPADYAAEEVDLVVMSSEREVSDQVDAAAARTRRRFKRRLTPLREFAAEPGVSTGPTISVAQVGRFQPPP